MNEHEKKAMVRKERAKHERKYNKDYIKPLDDGLNHTLDRFTHD